MTETSKEKYVSLKHVPYIYYLLCFQKDTIGIRALIDLGNKVNAMVPAYALKLGLKVYLINIRAQTIDASIFKTFKMVLASFPVEDKLRKARVFQKTFLLANINIEIVLSILFLTFNYPNV